MRESFDKILNSKFSKIAHHWVAWNLALAFVTMVVCLILYLLLGHPEVASSEYNSFSSDAIGDALLVSSGAAHAGSHGGPFVPIYSGIIISVLFISQTFKRAYQVEWYECIKEVRDGTAWVADGKIVNIVSSNKKGFSIYNISYHENGKDLCSHCEIPYALLRRFSSDNYPMDKVMVFKGTDRMYMLPYSVLECVKHYA